MRLKSLRRLICYRTHFTKVLFYIHFKQHWPQVPTEKWHARDWKCSISMTTNGLCNVFWPICDFWRKKLIYGTLAHFYTANTVLQLILPISLHFGEKTSAKSGINTAMYDFLVFFRHRPTRLLDHFSADGIHILIFTEMDFEC